MSASRPQLGASRTTSRDRRATAVGVAETSGYRMSEIRRDHATRLLGLPEGEGRRITQLIVRRSENVGTRAISMISSVSGDALDRYVPRKRIARRDAELLANSRERIRQGLSPLGEHSANHPLEHALIGDRNGRRPKRKADDSRLNGRRWAEGTSRKAKQTCHVRSPLNEHAEHAVIARPGLRENPVCHFSLKHEVGVGYDPLSLQSRSLNRIGEEML